MVQQWVSENPAEGPFPNTSPTRIRDITDGTSCTFMMGEIQEQRTPWAQGGNGSIRPFIEKPYINGPDGWGGKHKAGTYFLFADGSVRCINEAVDPMTMEALTSIAGGEVHPEIPKP